MFLSRWFNLGIRPEIRVAACPGTIVPPITMNPRTLYTVLEQTAAAHGRSPALYQPSGGKDGKYTSYSWNEYRDAAREIAVGLCRLGAGKGDIVAIYCETRAEF